MFVRDIFETSMGKELKGGNVIRTIAIPSDRAQELRRGRILQTRQ